ncbi:MAG: hypothetical protein ABR549_14695 [Mycobacteriales bacterium]
MTIRLPPSLGGTTCSVRRLGACPAVVVELGELNDNPGLPVSCVFSPLSDVLRTAWFPCGHEPVWIEHHPQRALADLLMRDRVTMARHRLTLTAGGVVREPLSRRRFAQLVGGDG